MNIPPTAMNWTRGLLGAVLGGVVGYFVYCFLWKQGMQALALPGASIGLGCGGLLRAKSIGLGVVCGVAALMLGIFVEWQFSPFLADPSFFYFIKNLGSVKQSSLVMIAVGVLCAYWLGRGRDPAT
jgi:hypothetical protein